MTRGREGHWPTASKALEKKNVDERIVVTLSMHSPTVIET